MLDVLVKAFLKSQQKQQHTKKCVASQTKFAVKNKQVQTDLVKSLTVQSPNDDYDETVTPNKEKSSSENSSGGDDTYSTSDFLDPQQVVSPPLSNNPSEMSHSTQRRSTSPRLGRSLSTSKSPTRDSEDHNDSNEDSNISPSSPPTQTQETAQTSSFDNEFQLKRPTKKQNPTTSSSTSSASDTTSSPSRKMSLAESLLQSKQNILAQGCLSQSEIQKRNRNRRRSLSEDNQVQRIAILQKLGQFQKPEGDGVVEQKKPGRKNSTGGGLSLELCDIEDEDFNFGERSGMIHIRKNKPVAQEKSQLDFETWRKLKFATVGLQGFVQEGWIGQGFSFNADVPFGLVQNKGGPCGVLAVVQALILRNLMFGSKYSKDIPIARNEILSTLQKSEMYENNNSYSALISKRSDALCSALVEILWRCNDDNDNEKGNVKICLKGNEPGSELLTFNKFEDLESFMIDNCYRFDCLGLVYSAILTRGVDRIEEDMDFPEGNPLIGKNGYCSLEMINLLLFGKCTSNVFDNEVVLDDKTLRGIKSQSDIGFLSLFEHYGSCEVGSFFKSPKSPIWIVCSESHFSILFSPNLDIVSRDKESSVFNNGFDLFYYDGLARQQQIIRLTICFQRITDNQGSLSLPNQLATGGGGAINSISNDAVDGVGSTADHLIPPLEKCIRTKWKHAKIFWNGVEPLL